MSRLRGSVIEPWSLSRAADALGDAARAAGRPGALWLAGLVYPGLNLGFLTGSQLLSRDEGFWEGMDPAGFAWPLAGLMSGSMFVLMFVALPIYSRLTAGLARIAPPEVWERASGVRGRPRLRHAWRAGRGITGAAMGMWVLLAVLFFVTAAVLLLGLGLVIQATGGEVARGALLLLTLPLLVWLSVYALVISILHQLALHSLTHNRRGVASALAHAWTLVRNDPWATARTVGLDVVLQLFVWAATLALVLPLLPFGLAGLAAIPALALNGYAGVTRAGFWARAYRALGGLSPEDGVPGLDPVGTAGPRPSRT